jgi:hypothetical protein
MGAQMSYFAAGLFACLAGFGLGFAYSWQRLAFIRAREINEVISIPIDETNKFARLARAQTVGRIKGLSIGASLFIGGIGAAIGLMLWAFGVATLFFVERAA